ncbi:MAG TPA: hypothetical protein VGN81_04325 [Pseudonocardiaceae bacterium]
MSGAAGETHLPAQTLARHRVLVEDQAVIDERILAEKIIPALRAIRAELGCGLHESLDEFQRRYNRLRTERPDDFVLSPEEYGHNFYS